MFTSGADVKPDDGASGSASSRSFESFLKYVRSKPSRSWKKPASNPPSVSTPRSGLRSGLPGLPGETPGRTTPASVRYGDFEYVWSAAVLPGDRPVVPHAPRRRNVEMNDGITFAIAG